MIMIGVFMLLSYMLRLQIRVKLTALMLLLRIILLRILETIVKGMLIMVITLGTLPDCRSQVGSQVFPLMNVSQTC